MKICVPYAKAFLIHGVTVLPFTVDHLGGLGSFASSFLFGSSATATIQPAEKAPLWTLQDFRFDQVAFSLYQQIDKIAPKALFPRADKTWRAATNSARYGSSYHTQFPSQWALQALALNISVGLAEHLITSASANLTPNKLRKRKTHRDAQRGTPPYPSPPIQFLCPGPSFHDINASSMLDSNDRPLDS